MLKTKICCHCKKEFFTSFFCVERRSKDGHSAYCNDCRSQMKLERDIKNSIKNNLPIQCPYCRLRLKSTTAAMTHYTGWHLEEGIDEYRRFVFNGGFDKKLCECGCGEEISPRGYFCGIRSIHGHLNKDGNSTSRLECYCCKIVKTMECFYVSNKKPDRWDMACIECRHRNAKNKLIEKSKKENFKLQCPFCELRPRSYRAAMIHYYFTHKDEDILDYRRMIYGKELTPKVCKCGCLEEIDPRSFKEGVYFKQGHYAAFAREKSYLKHKTKEHIDSTTETLRKHYASGEIIAWNKGKNFSMEPRLQHGPRNGRWKGGISSLGEHCRVNIRLYHEWKFPILQRDNFMCTQCGDTKQLEVDHNEITFSTILRMIAKQFNWTETFSRNTEASLELHTLKQQISEAIVDYHVQNKVSGIVLCKTCHQQKHISYRNLGNTSTKKEQPNSV